MVEGWWTCPLFLDQSESILTVLSTLTERWSLVVRSRSMSDGFYDDWIASDDTSDHYDPIQAQIEGQLEELERERENNE